MKIFIKFILFILVLGLAGPFIIRGPDGAPLMDFSDFIPSFSSWKPRMQHWWSDVGAQISNVGAHSDIGEKEQQPGLGALGKTQVFQWRDTEGVWRYSDRRPAGVESETIWIDPNMNVMWSNSSTVREIPEEEDNAAQSPGFELPLPLTVSPSEATRLMEDAKNVKELMEKRNEMLESLSGGSKKP